MKISASETGLTRSKCQNNAGGKTTLKSDDLKKFVRRNETSHKFDVFYVPRVLWVKTDKFETHIKDDLLLFKI